MQYYFIQSLVIKVPFDVYFSAPHYSDVMMSTMASQITGVSSVYSDACSGADQNKQQSSASLAFVKGIQWGPVISPHKGPVTRKIFPFDDVIIVVKPNEVPMLTDIRVDKHFLLRKRPDADIVTLQ